ncbi:MAG: DUF2933 domain-containing protein [Alphaproteobacteria bacterium]|nr:DUF2933 domain-containing protein [Alphaproteobacteria bacterium]
MSADHPGPWWWSKSLLVILGFLAIAAFFVMTEHRAHLYGAVPYLLLLACPLMHLFMHRDHGGHGGRPQREGDRRTGGGRHDT